MMNDGARETDEVRSLTCFVGVTNELCGGTIVVHCLPVLDSSAYVTDDNATLIQINTNYFLYLNKY